MKNRAAFDAETFALESLWIHTALIFLSSQVCVILLTYKFLSLLHRTVHIISLVLCLQLAKKHLALMHLTQDIRNPPGNKTEECGHQSQRHLWSTKEQVWTGPASCMSKTSTLTRGVFIIYALPVLTTANLEAAGGPLMQRLLRHRSSKVQRVNRLQQFIGNEQLSTDWFTQQGMSLFNMPVI